MEKAKIIQIEGVGQVALERSARAKRLVISIRPFRKPRVAVPLNSTFKKAEEFALSKKNWLIKTTEKIKGYENELSRQEDSVGAIDKQAAARFLVQRTKIIAQKYGFTYNKVTIRNQKTRWGSCSHTNNISLNMQLVRLPQELIDYVILHELAHTKIKNHSHAFWTEMEKLDGKSKQMRLKMRKYRPV